MEQTSKIAAFACICTILCVCPDAGSCPPQVSEMRLKLDLPRAPVANEAIRAEVTVGTLPQKARLIVRTADGKIAGTISPFGVRPGQKAGVYTIPIPKEVVADGKVLLRLELVPKDAKARAPNKEEVEQVKLTLIPATR